MSGLSLNDRVILRVKVVLRIAGYEIWEKDDKSLFTVVAKVKF